MGVSGSSELGSGRSQNKSWAQRMNCASKLRIGWDAWARALNAAGPLCKTLALVEVCPKAGVARNPIAVSKHLFPV